MLVYVADLDMRSTRVDFVPVVKMHSKYLAFASAAVQAGSTSDGKTLLYNDTIDGTLQICAVDVH